MRRWKERLGYRRSLAGKKRRCGRAGSYTSTVTFSCSPFCHSGLVNSSTKMLADNAAVEKRPLAIPISRGGG